MIITFLDDLKDHRRSQGQRYELRFIVLFSIMAILSNAKSYRDIARFIEKHFRNLQKDFGLKWKKKPAYTTVRNIIQGIDEQELESCFRAYAQSLLTGAGNDNPIGVAVDGKVLRGSYDNFQDKKAVQVLSFFDTQSELILAHETIDVKTNEIPVAQALIPQLGLEGVVYTLDALHCQKKTFEIADNENMKKKKLIIQVKDNQKELLQACMDIIRFSKPESCCQTSEKGRNRIEKRSTSVYHSQMQFICDKQWSGYVESVICVERQTSVFSTKEKIYKDRSEVAVYIANHKVNAMQSSGLIRKHWYIENKDHHVRDVTLREDESRIRVRPEKMSTIRSFALNVLRKNNIQNIKGELYENSLDFYNLYSYKQFI
ncbi:MAG TPA: ISAs1 family transposase [Draconibacterium sp.]|nr:ISAs1 family transposase [Draconibacterium sp.]